jgi:hypothetical protein
MILADGGGCSMSKRKVMAKAKVYGFTPWVDQVDAINQIMRESGEKTESGLLRKLIDEALDARRKKSSSVPPVQEAHTESGSRLETIESLLMRLVRQGDTSLRIQDVCLALLQDVLAEAHATRRLSWESLVMPQVREKGVDASELERRFMLQADRAKDYAYGVAERIKETQETQK